MEMQLHDAVAFTAPLILSGIATAALHWFPGAQGQHALTRYVLGTGVTVGIPAAAMLLTAALGLAYGHVFWAALLVVNAAVAGATVAAAYWIDATAPVSLDDIAEEQNAPER
jgi:hypothetical protein